VIDSTHKTDAQLQQDVLNELALDSRIDETESASRAEWDRDVDGDRGVVREEARRAGCGARVLGVLDVANDLEVRPPGGGAPSDTEIAAAVRNALLWDTRVPHTKVHSTVAHGSSRSRVSSTTRRNARMRRPRSGTSRSLG